MFKFKKKKEKPFVSAIVAAGGTGQRMGSNKLLMELDGIPVLAHTLLALQQSDLIVEIIISAHKDSIVEYGQLAVDFGIRKLKSVVSGGENRSISVLKGVLEADPKCKFALIHDGARPFVAQWEIQLVIEKAFTDGAATASVPVKDTIKQVLEGKIKATAERSNLVQVQTPQVFDIDLIKGALSKVVTENIPVTDDCQALEIMGFQPSVVTTSYENIKITTMEDLIAGQAILDSRKVRK